MRELTHFVDGKHVDGTSGRFAEGFQPMTGEAITKVPLASRTEVRRAVESSLAAQPAWAAVNPQRRARVLTKFIELVARDNDKIAEIIAREHGKTIPDAKGDIQRGHRSDRSSACGIAAPDEGRVHRGRRARASTSTRCASRSASWRASRRSTSPR